MIRNVHSREFAAEPARVGELIDSLASAGDQLWPVPRWPAMELDGGLRPGSKGGHGPVRYAVEAVDPGRAVVFRFDPAIGLQGTHGFSVSSDGPGRTTLTHVLEGRAIGAGRLLWPLALRWMHDALIEDAFDRASASLAARQWTPRRLGLWVRLCRAGVARARTRAGLTGSVSGA